MLETVLCGFTEIVAENLNTEIERLEQKQLDKSFTGFEIEFKVSCFLHRSFFNIITIHILFKYCSSCCCLFEKDIHHWKFSNPMCFSGKILFNELHSHSSLFICQTFHFLFVHI